MKFNKINIPIYRKTFYIITDKESYYLLYLKYKGEDIDLSTCNGVCSEIGTGYYLLGVFDGKISTLIHELTHLSMYILDNGDKYDFRENDEQLAYLMEYLTEKSLTYLSVKNKSY